MPRPIVETPRDPASKPLRVPGSHHGFSLVEVAIAVAIMGLLLGSLIVPFAAQSEMRARRATEKALADTRDALVGYAAVNGRLPCPAAATAAAGAAGAGVEARTDGNCSCAGATALASTKGIACSTATVVGVLPWVTLGLAETDGWGRRYTYAVDTQFGRDPGQTTFGCSPNAPPAGAAFALCSPSHIEVRSARGGPLTVSGGVPAVVVSHGKNGFGAYTPQGSAIAGADANADELENANGDAAFVSNTNSDDQIVWVPPYLLMHRMLSAGMLP
jgi:prepilin-type N-terminal cleavage/methylation domain-containing protein